MRARLVLRTVFVLRPVRVAWVDAIRAGACVGTVIAIGWWAGDLEAGLIASLGGLTALYGSGRPYSHRTRELAAIAIALSLTMTLGVASAALPWAPVPAVAAIAMAATWLCQALDTGPPGAYMFVLACASATAIAPPELPWRAGSLVLAGGASSWLVHMAGYLIRPYGPETCALAAGAAAVVHLSCGTRVQAPVPAIRDSAQFLDIDMQQVTARRSAWLLRPGRTARRRRREPRLHGDEDTAGPRQ